MIRGIIFDCFGVLYTDVTRAYFSRFPSLAAELHDLNTMSDHGFIDKPTYIKRVAELTGVSEADTITGFANEHVFNKPLVTLIHGLRGQGYKIGLLSNVGRSWLDDFFDEHQLKDLFDSVVRSSEEGITKPNPILFERAAMRLGLLPEECVMIDDRSENCEGAKVAGMKSILYQNNDQLLKDLNGLLKEPT